MSYNFEVQGGKSYNIPVGGKYCPDNIVITAKGGGVEINVITASELPATVVENQIVVITSTPANNIYVATNEPESPANGDIWVKVAEGDYGVSLSDESPYLDLRLVSARQYDSGVWNAKDGYVGISGVWEQFVIALPEKGTPLSDWTWQQIIDLCNSNLDASEYFAVGDTKDLVLSTGEVVPAVIGAFKHSRIYQTSSNAQIAFTTKNCLSTRHQINTTATNVGGWDSSIMRKTHMANIFATFPAELQADNGIKVVEVVTSAGNGSTTLVTSADRLRLHSVTELGMAGSNANGEGSVYDYYASGNRIKQIAGANVNYWTRSPAINGNSTFCYINTSGLPSSVNAQGSNGVACAFDI